MRIWDELVVSNSKNGARYEQFHYHYGSVGCPGAAYESKCKLPEDCASKGRCRLNFELDARKGMA